MKSVENGVIAAIIDRLKLFLPEKMANSVERHPNNPADITKDVLDSKYPYGFFTVQCPGSEKYEDGRNETLFFMIHVWGSDIDRQYDLARAVKIIVNLFRPVGGNKLEFHAEKIELTEWGVWVRSVAFSMYRDLKVLSEREITAQLAELEL
jgi:hypothetical protein